MDVLPGHYRATAAEQETVRTAPMGKVQRQAETTCPAVYGE
jgi:hypothetical protein